MIKSGSKTIMKCKCILLIYIQRIYQQSVLEVIDKLIINHYVYVTTYLRIHHVMSLALVSLSSKTLPARLGLTIILHQEHITMHSWLHGLTIIIQVFHLTVYLHSWTQKGLPIVLYLKTLCKLSVLECISYQQVDAPLICYTFEEQIRT